MEINALADEIAEELDLDAVAKRDALAGIPASDAKKLTGAEDAAMQKVRQKGGEAVDLLDRHCRETREAIQECKPQIHIPIDEPDAAEPSRDILDGRRSESDRAAAAYNKFKVENGLERDASGDDRVTQILWALVVVLVEGALNAYFFAPVSEHGLAGGFVPAFFIGSVNVAFAFLGGALGLRYAINHIVPFFKLCGLVWFGGCCLISAAMISLATLYRGSIEKFKALELESADIAANASREAITNLFALDWGALFNSVDSFILFFVGLLCAMFGIWKGYEFDDPYPAFGTMWRQKEAARIPFEEENEKHRKETAKWRSRFADQIRGKMGELKDAARELQLKRGGLKEQVRAVEDVPDDAVALAGNLIDRYRAMNKSVRAAPASPPQYFSNAPSRDSFSRLIEQCEMSLREAEKLGAEADEVIKESKEKCAKLQRMLGGA